MAVEELAWVDDSNFVIDYMLAMTNSHTQVKKYVPTTGQDLKAVRDELLYTKYRGIILDSNMPTQGVYSEGNENNKVAGLMLLKDIRKGTANSNTPVVMYTSEDDSQYVDLARQWGANA